MSGAEAAGLRTGEVADLLDTGRRRHAAPDLRERAIGKIAEIDQKIADLTTIRASLTEVVDARCDSLTNCTCADCPIPYLTIGAAERPSGDCA